MKTRYVIISVALAMVLGTSCQQREKLLFEESSSARMESFLDNVQNVISHPKNGYGWYMAYFTDQEKTAGGTTYTIQFDKPAIGQATIFHESVKPAEGWGDTCTYKLTRDDGPVLSFDGYNVAMHYYSTSSSQYYQSQGGDFEFDVVSACADSVVLRGKRTRNTFKMYALEEAPDTYMEKVVQMGQDLSIGMVKGEITGGLIQMELDLGNRTISIGRKDAADSEKVSVPYIITPTGFKLYETLYFQGVKFKDFVLGENKTSLISNGVTFDMVIPEGYMPYEKYVGKYVLTTGDLGDFNVEITAEEVNRSFLLKGINSKFDVTLMYNSGQGAINWFSQEVGRTEEDHVIWLCAWAVLNGQDGTFTWTPTVGMRSVVDDPEKDAFVLKMADYGTMSGNTIDSYILFDFTGYQSTQAFAAPPESWYFEGGNYRFKGPFTLTKIVED